MNNFIKKSFLISMVVITALWGVLGVVTPAAANVAVAGDLIKSTTSPAVYYLDSSNTKHPFNHEREYYTWYSNFSGVKTIPTDEMVSYTLGSPVVVRPGSRLVQYVETLGDGTWNVSNTPQVYALGANGQLQQLASAADAVVLYGANWESKIIPLPNYLSSNYTIGAAMTSTSNYPTGTLVKTADSATVYYIDGTTKRPVTDAGLTANRFNLNYVVTAASLASYTDGTSISDKEDAIANPIAGTVSGGVATGTGLTVALAAGNPGANVIPGAATNVPLMKFNVTAGADGTVTVNQINVHKLGLGYPGDFSYLYLYDGATRLTNGKTISSSSRIVQFGGLNLAITAGSTKTLTLSADMAALGTSATAGISGGVHYFAIESGAVTTNGATVNGSFPIQSNVFTIGSVSAGTIVIDRNGSLTNPVVGQVDADLAQFKLSAGSGENVTLNRVTLYQGGSINNAYVTNLKLWQGSTLLASTASINAKALAVFELTTPFTLEKSTNRIFKVTGTINGASRNGDTTKFYLENAADLYAIGANYSYGVGVDMDSDNAADDQGYSGVDTTCTTQSSCIDSTYLVVQGGQITIAKTGPQAATLARGTTGATLLTFSITAGVNAEIRKMRIELHNDAAAESDIGKTAATDASTSDSCANDYIKNVKIVDTATGESTDPADCSGFTNIGDRDGVYKEYTDTFTVAAGQTRNFAVKADLHSSLDADDYFAVLGRSGSHETTSNLYAINTADGIKNTDNNQWITDIVPNSAISGNEMSIAAAGLGVALNSNAAPTTVIQGANDVNLGEIAFNTKEGSPITISTLSLTGYIASTSPTSDGSVKAVGCSAGEAGNNYCVNMGGDVFSYIHNLVSSLRVYDVTNDPEMTTNLNSSGSVNLGSSDGKANFTSMNWTIPAGTTRVLRVVGNISSTAYANAVSGAKYIKLNIATADDVTARNSEGNSATLSDNDWTTYAITDVNGAATTMASSYYLAIAEAGTINVTADGNAPTANVVAGDDVPVLKLNFHAVNEAFNVNKLRITQSQSGYNRAVSAATISWTGATPVTQNMVSGIADFNISATPIVVSKNGNVAVTVTFTLSTIDQAANAYTGDLVKATFDYDDNFEARSVQGSTTKVATSNAVDVTGNVMTVHGSLPTFTVNDSDTSTTLANGPAQLYKFIVSASEGDYGVTLKKITFKLSMTDVTRTTASLSLTNFKVLEGSSFNTASEIGAGSGQADSGTDTYRIYNGLAATNTTANGIGTGAILSTAAGVIYENYAGSVGVTDQYITVVFNDDRQIAPGESLYYIISATAANVITAGDSVSMYLYNGDTTTTSYKFIEACVAGNADCSTTDTVAGKRGKYYLTDDASGTNEAAAFMIWSDKTGTDGSGSHTDLNVTNAQTGYGSTGDFFNGYNIKTHSIQRSLTKS